MKLLSLSVRNYRNLCDATFDISGDSIGLVGENGQGKTNLLESIYLFSSGDAWRGDEDADVIRFGESFARIDGTFFDEDTMELSLFLEKQEHTNRLKKQYLVNGISRKKETLTSQVAVVLFHPEDIQIVNGSPSSRRALLDACISEAFPYYRRVVSQYGKVITSRNRLLDAIREGVAKENQLEYWTDSMVRLGSEIYLYRYRFFSFISKKLEDYGVAYNPHIVCDCDSSDGEFLSTMEKVYAQRAHTNIEKEIKSAISQYGPHKDDYNFLIGERDIGRFGSRGEQRAVLFAFKKAHVSYIEEVRKMKPILLLDDIFSEFDSKHRDTLAVLCAGYQTFVTGTEEQFFTEEKFPFDSVYRVDNGLVRE